MRRLVLLAAPIAALAVWLWQAELPARIASVPAGAVFTDAQIARAQDYRDPGYLMALARMLVPVAAALLLAWRGGRLAGRRPPVVVALLVALALGALVTPIDAVDHVRARNVGLDLRDWSGWASDEALAVGLQAVAVAIAYEAGRRLLRRWGPLAAGLGCWAVVGLFALVQPVIVPLPFATRPPSPMLRTLVAGLERHMNVRPHTVVVGEAGRQTTAENAQVDGVGPTERLIVYDTAVRGSTLPELRALVAHELGHVERMHMLKGVLWFGVIGLPALLLVLAAAGRLTAGRPGGLLGGEAVPVVLAGVVVAATLLTPVENLISRRYEAEADWVGLRATGDPAGMIALQKRLALADLSNPEPPGWAVWLLFDHPPLMDRIGAARAYSSSSSSASPSPSSSLSPSNSGRLLIPSRVRHLE